MNYNIFEGEQVRLRSYVKEDIPTLTKYLNHPEVSLMLLPTIAFPRILEEEYRWFEELRTTNNDKYSFAIEYKKDKSFIGGCSIRDIDLKNRTGLLSIFLGKRHFYKGYGTDAMRLLVSFCFGEINLNKAKLYVFDFNKPAIKVYQRLGFTIEGTLRQEIFRNGRYHDVLIMGILRAEWGSL